MSTNSTQSETKSTSPTPSPAPPPQTTPPPPSTKEKVLTLLRELREVDLWFGREASVSLGDLAILDPDIWAGDLETLTDLALREVWPGLGTEIAPSFLAIIDGIITDSAIGHDEQGVCIAVARVAGLFLFVRKCIERQKNPIIR